MERKIGPYTVLNAVRIGKKEIAIGEDEAAEKDERFLCCLIEANAVFERYIEVVVSDEYAEIAKVFGERIVTAANEVISAIEEAKKVADDNKEILPEECDRILWEDSIEGEVVVVNGNVLRPEYRLPQYQLLLCVGGFGSRAKARGRTCLCVSLYDGETMSYVRSDFIGTMKPENLPKWARLGYENALLKIKKEEESNDGI